MSEYFKFSKDLNERYKIGELVKTRNGGLNIALTGRLPPPVGGVTMFIKNFIEASKWSENLEVTLLGRKHLFSGFDVLVVNSSNSIKRFLFVVWSKLFGAKALVVKHGSVFNLDNPFDRLSIKWCDGVICLNELVFNQIKHKNQQKKAVKISTMFKQNVDDLLIEHSFGRQLSPEYILFYCNNSGFIDGQEIYGANFFSKCIDELNKKYDLKFVVIDLSGSYRQTFKKYDNVVYLDKTVNFRDFLLKSLMYVRPTSTDGNSVALLEALALGVPCLASDAVPRPPYVRLYKYGDVQDFCEKVIGIVDEEDEGLSKKYFFTDFQEIEKFLIEMFDS